MKGRVLVVDDDPAMCRLLKSGLQSIGLAVETCTAIAEALARFSEEDFDAVVTDVKMRGGSGLELCERVVETRSDVPVIVITAFGSMDAAIEAIRSGAYDFITKPFELDRIRLTVERAVAHRRLRQRVFRLEHALEETYRFEDLIGKSTPMQKVYDLVSRVAQTDTTVLVTGESGTGKELVARAIHARSARADQPFVAINCAAVPSTLLESELFGHVKGAFTDARADRAGVFQAARGGTLFLDEVAELPLELQPKLLRTLQERRIRPVGSNQEVPFEARIVAASNRDLEEAVNQGLFRSDLYYRINVIEIEMPALRARGNDVLLLVQHFVKRYREATGKKVDGITPGVAEKLLAYHWPGNVRELQNCIERAVTLSRYSEITVDDLPERIRGHRPDAERVTDLDSLLPMDEVERRYVLRVYDATGGNKSLAAKILGFNRKTLYRKLVRYGVVGAALDDEDSSDGEA